MSQRASGLSGLLRKSLQSIGMLRAILVSGVLGGNLATLALIRRPRAAMAYIQYGLFGWRMVRGQGLPQRQFHALFLTPDQVSVSLLPTSGYLTN